MRHVQDEDGGDGTAGRTAPAGGRAARGDVVPGNAQRVDRAAPAGRAAPVPIDLAAPAGLHEHLPHPATRPGLGALVAVLLSFAAAAGLYASFVGSGPALADGALLQDSLEIRSGGLTGLAVVVTNVGNTTSMAVLAVAVGAWCWYAGRRADAVLAIGAMAGGAALFRTLKEVLDRPRPPAALRLVEATNESLPSGHATMSIVVIGTVVVLAWARRAATTRAALVSVAVVWVGAVGATRIYLGVHWFSDVVAGWLVGAAWLALCVALWSWWRTRHPEPALVE
ncbi:phosphatase PAP2 family protein [Pseudonocardia xinjiangensis]